MAWSACGHTSPRLARHDSRVDLVCPGCGSDRVILLTFPPVFGEVSTETPERPVAKCAVCGYRLTAAEVADQEEPPPD